MSASKKVSSEQVSDEKVIKSHSIVPLRWKIAYELTSLPGTNGDALAHAFSEAVVDDDARLDLKKLYQVGRQNGIDVVARWGARNPGQQRMNLGNVLRGMLRRGEMVKIGKETWNAKPPRAKKAKAEPVAETPTEPTWKPEDFQPGSEGPGEENAA